MVINLSEFMLLTAVIFVLACLNVWLSVRSIRKAHRLQVLVNELDDRISGVLANMGQEDCAKYCEHVPIKLGRLAKIESTERRLIEEYRDYFIEILGIPIMSDLTAGQEIRFVQEAYDRDCKKQEQENENG